MHQSIAKEERRDRLGYKRDMGDVRADGQHDESALVSGKVAGADGRSLTLRNARRDYQVASPAVAQSASH